MTVRLRIWLLGTVACALVACSAPAAQAATPFGVEKFVAANCKAGYETCAEEAVGPIGPFTYSLPKEPTLTEAREAGYTQAAGHPTVGVTAFDITTTGTLPNAAPTGIVTHIRTDVAPGVSTNPEAVPQCSFAQFGEIEAIAGTGFYAKPTCSESGSESTVIGVNKVVVYTGSEAFPKGGDLPLEGTVYNLVQPKGLASDFGVALKLPVALTAAVLEKAFAEKGHPLGEPTEKDLEAQEYYAHTLIEGGVEWAGDYHDYYEINVSKALPLISSRLALKGDIGTTGLGGFITNPSVCAGSGPETTNTVTLDETAGGAASKQYTTPIGTEGCKGESPFLTVPFAPEFKLTPETTQSDEPDGITTEVKLPHDPNPEHIDTSQLKTAGVTLPEGMTLNPSAAQGLEACTPAQARIHSHESGVACPPKSSLGTVTLNVPDLPAESLQGSVYLGAEENSTTHLATPITGPPYTVYVNAESKRYGVDVRLQGTVATNEATGRVTATFAENPQQPFSDAILHFKGGALAPIANPLTCGVAKAETSLTPYTGTATQSPFSEFTVESNGKGAACASPLPFSLTQSTAVTPTTGGAATNFTLGLARADGQQYLAKVSATLPAGLVGKIPAVPLCGEPQASLGTCSASSQIGTATATVGSGPTPVQFTGPVYLTGPTGSAPYGMTTVINAAVGPFSLGNDVVRTGIEVNPFTARVTVAGAVPTIFKGVPLRLKALSVAINRQGFLVNPTNCAALATETTLTSSLGSAQSLSTPFQAAGCSSLAFKPKFTASSNAKTSRANGASLVVKVGYPAGVQANVKSVLVTLPKLLPSRLSTLKKACTEATFNANPAGCPSSSYVGTATVTTPVLPGKLTGPAFFVSHGGAAFPDLDFLLRGDGVSVVLVGTTNIKNGITTSDFASIPDVPVSSFEANLPTGKNSVLTATGNLCTNSLVMPTTITAQNGKVIKQNTPITVLGCPVRIVSHRVRGTTVILTVHVPAAGRVSGGGADLRTVYKHPGKAQNVTLEVPLSSAGRAALAARGSLTLRVRVGFLPKVKGASSTAYTTVVF